MVKIYAPLTRDDRFHCSSGSDVKPVFKLVGNHLVKQSEIIISEYINSFRDECLIENIIRRFNNGDLSALNRVQGAYIDSTQLPKDIHTANKMLNYAQTIYNSLGSDLKKDYPDFSSFIDTFANVESINQFVSRFGATDKGPDPVDKVDSGGNVNV